MAQRHFSGHPGTGVCDYMTTIALYSVQPILIAGLQSTVETSLDLAISAACSSFSQLLDHVRVERPNLILVELTPDITPDALSQFSSQGVDARVIVWVDSVSAEFASQAIAAGVRGILRRSLPIELQVKCLRKVAAGELWVEQNLSEQILYQRQTALTQRESHLAGLLTHGLKNKEIAYSMGISEGTVKVYLSRLFQKSGAKDRFELALFGLKHLPSVPVDAPDRLAGASMNALEDQAEAGRPNLNVTGAPSLSPVPVWIPRGQRVQGGERPAWISAGSARTWSQSQGKAPLRSVHRGASRFSTIPHSMEQHRSERLQPLTP